MRQADLAIEAKMGQSQLSKYVNGVNSPSLEAIDRIAKALGCGPWELFVDEDSKPSKTEMDYCFRRVNMELNRYLRRKDFKWEDESME